VPSRANSPTKPAPTSPRPRRAKSYGATACISWG
jgi:hypothetical protein